LFGELSGGRHSSYEGYYKETKTYNVDLNTGKEISIEKVFADNVDHREIILEEAKKVLDRYLVEVDDDILAESLAQYLTEPQFLLSDSSFQPVGFRYPDSSLYNEILDIDIYNNGHFAYIVRFYDPDKNIYLNDAEGVKMLPVYFSEEVRLERNYTEDGINIYLLATYQIEFPDHAQQIIKAEESVNDELIEEIKAVLRNVAEEEVVAQYNKIVNSSRTQDFINVWIYESVQIDSLTTDFSYRGSAPQTLRCYPVGGGGPVNIRDIFREGTDPEKILETVMYNKLEAAQRSLEESGWQSTIDSAAHAKGATDKFVGFCINQEAIQVEYLGNHALPSYVIELKYSEIGFENLSIFE
jgi:hypothetical protein